jgi:large subunit ribosomal protein L30
MAKLKITLTRSLIGQTEKQRATVKALGLGKTNTFVIQEDTPVIQGMVKKVAHLVTVEKE